MAQKCQSVRGPAQDVPLCVVSPRGRYRPYLVIWVRTVGLWLVGRRLIPLTACCTFVMAPAASQRRDRLCMGLSIGYLASAGEKATKVRS